MEVFCYIYLYIFDVLKSIIHDFLNFNVRFFSIKQNFSFVCGFYIRRAFLISLMLNVYIFYVYHLIICKHKYFALSFKTVMLSFLLWTFHIILDKNTEKHLWLFLTSVGKCSVFFFIKIMLASIFNCLKKKKKKAECQRIDAFDLWCCRRLLRIPWTARRSNQSILKEISP